MSAALQEAITVEDYVFVAIITAVGYDYLLTFPQEIEYIWNRPWTRVSTLFILSRYCGLISLITYCFEGVSFMAGGSANICSAIGIIHIWSYNLFLGSADLMMVLRTWAMYDRSRAILVVLLTLYFVEMAPAFILAGLDSDAKYLAVSVVHELGSSSFCSYNYTQLTGTWSEAVIILQMIFGGVLCMLVSAQCARRSLQMYHATNQWQLNQYMGLLVRQGVVYFFAFFLLNLINLLFALNMLPAKLWVIILLFPIELVPAYTLTPRFILSIRELYAHSIQSGHSQGNRMDSGFGLSGRSASGANTGMTTMVFEDSIAKIGLEEVEEVPLMGITTMEVQEPA